MKHGNNNEVDLLLRSLAQRRDVSALQERVTAGDGSQVSSDHLDADELNSYSEGVVPAPARARYTEHLAECDACRGIVVSLSQAAGFPTHSAAPEPESGVGFWQKLSALFPAPVLRYAVPALVLAAVIGVGLLAMRQRQPDFMALNQTAEPAISSDQRAHTEGLTKQSTTDEPSGVPKRSESPPATDQIKEKDILRDDNTPRAPVAGTGTGEGADVIVTSKDAKQPEEVSRVELRPTYAPEPKATAAPGVGSVSEAENSAKLAKEQPAKREDHEGQRDSYKNSPTDEHGPNRSAAQRSAGAPASNRRLDGLSAGRGGPYQEKKDKAGEVETRSVSGRRFAREGNAWVDTAYDPSRTPVRVARGSEQFRALVADEPGLRAIAEQLGGVVVVVWKNRAYRIQ